MDMLYLWSEDNPRNWSEDFSHENGKYINSCCICKLEFLGHKRRVICKQCYTTNKQKSEVLRCHYCKNTYTFPAKADLLEKLPCEFCKESHMRLFWIELSPTTEV